MHLNTTRTASRLKNYQLSTFISFLAKVGLYVFLLRMIILEWSYITVFYTTFFFYIITQQLRWVRTILQTVKERRRKGYVNVTMYLKMINPNLSYQYKAAAYFAVIMLVKTTVSYVFYSDMADSLLNNSQLEDQILRDFGLSVEQDSFTFMTMVFNLLPELVVLGLIMIIMMTESHQISLEKADFMAIKRRYNKEKSALCSILFSFSIMLIPIVESSPLTMIPLGVYMLVLFYLYTWKGNFASTVSYPMVVTILSCIAFTLLKVRSFTQLVGQAVNHKDIFLTKLVLLDTDAFTKWTGLISVFLSASTVISASIFKDCEALKSLEKVFNMNDEGESSVQLDSHEDSVSPSQLFAHKFDVILGLDASKQLNFENNFKHDYIDELKDLINVEKYKRKCIRERSVMKVGFLYKAKKFFAGIGIKLSNWAKASLKYLSRGVIMIFSNSILLLMLETGVACFFVVFISVNIFAIPVIFWIFTSSYFKLNSLRAMQHKCIFLVLFSFICCFFFKYAYHEDISQSLNPDFNFKAPNLENYYYSIAGLSVILLVKMELIAHIIRSKHDSEKTDFEKIDHESTETLPEWAIVVINGVANNKIYFVAISLYIIAININILNYIVIIFLCIILLSRSKTQEKTLVMVMMTNQLTLVIRYLFVIGTKQLMMFNWLSQREDLVNLIGLTDKETLGFSSVKLKIALNYILQYIFFIFMLVKKNPKVFYGKHTKDSRDEQGKYSTFFKNLKEWFLFAYFYSLPWIAYFTILILLVYSPPSLLGLVQVIMICLAINAHIRALMSPNKKNSGPNSFGGMLEISGTWNFLINASCIKALLRYTIWFSVKVYLQTQFTWIKTFYTFCEDYLPFLGILPSKGGTVFLELLPEFLTLFFGYLIRFRIKAVRFCKMNEVEILDLDMKKDWALNVYSIMQSNEFGEHNQQNQQDVNPKLLGDDDSSSSSTSLKHIVDTTNKQEMMLANQLSESEREKIKYMIWCRRRVFGDIAFKTNDGEKNYYLQFKLQMSLLFFFTAVFSTFFKLSISMGVLLMMSLMYYWTVHQRFWEETEKKKIDSKIQSRLHRFHVEYLTREGIHRGLSNDKKTQQALMERHLYMFTLKLKFTELIFRKKTWIRLRLFLIICLVGQYVSYLMIFVKLKAITKWINLGFFLMGWSNVNRNKILDVYGYYVLILLLVFEINTARKLKDRLKKDQIEASSGESYWSSKKTLQRKENEIHKPKRRMSLVRFTFRMLKSIKYDEDDFEDDYDMLNANRNRKSTLSSGRRSVFSLKGLNSKVKKTFKVIEFDGEIKIKKGHIELPNQKKQPSESEEVEILPTNPKTLKRQSTRLEEVEKERKMLKKNQLAKLVFFHVNKKLYLDCKFYYSLVTIMCRLVYFVMLYVYDSNDSLISCLAMITICIVWYTSSKDPKQSVQKVNTLVTCFVGLKYFIGVLNITSKDIYIGSQPEFETSLVLIFMTRTGHPYKIFVQIIGGSLQDGWLIFECCVFLIIQSLIYFYSSILNSNSYKLRIQSLRVDHMLENYISSTSAKTPLMINFRKWRTETFELMESSIKRVSVYAPVLLVLFISGASQQVTSMVLTAVILATLFLVYKIVFQWLLDFNNRMESIEKYYVWVQRTIWLYLIWGSFTRSISFEFPDMPILYSISFITCFSLVAFQLIRDLWSSTDFERYYKSLRLDVKFRSLAIPLAKIYRFNTRKLKSIFDKLEIKINSNQRIECMEKQLKIWHLKYGDKKELEKMDPDQRSIYEKKIANWTDYINRVNKEEVDAIEEIRENEESMSKVGFADKILTKIQLFFLYTADTYDYANNLKLFQAISEFNCKVVKAAQFDIIDYITENIKNNIGLIKDAVKFYKDERNIKRLLKEEDDKQNKLEQLKAMRMSTFNTRDHSVDHKLAANLLFSELTQPSKDQEKEDKQDSRHQIHSFNKTIEKEFAGEHLLIYNIAKAIERNSFHTRYTKMQQVSKILSYIPSFLYCNWKVTSLLLVILYCLGHPSVAKVPLLIYVILYGLTEENNLGRKFWKTIFLYMVTIMSIKFLLKSFVQIRVKGTISENNRQLGFYLNQTGYGLIQFLLGDINRDRFEVPALFAVLTRTIQAQFCGLFGKNLLYHENINKAFVRVKLNTGIKDFWRICYNESRQYLQILKRRYKISKEREERYSRIKVKKEGHINVYKLMPTINEYNRETIDFQKFSQVIKNAASHFETEVFQFKQSLVHDFQWRTFSKYNRKPGVNYYYFTIFLQMILALFTFFFFQNMQRTTEGLLSALNFKEFSGLMTLFLFTQIGFIVYDRCLYLSNPLEWRNWKMFRFEKKSAEQAFSEYILTEMLTGLEEERGVNKLRRVVRRVCLVRRLLSCSAEELSDLIEKVPEMKKRKRESEKPEADYKLNPLFKRFKFMRFLMIFIFGICFIYFPLSGNDKLGGSFLCNSTYKLYEQIPKTSCNYLADNAFTWAFFIIFTFYFCFSALQVRDGESFLKNQKKSTRRLTMIDKYMHTVITSAPFIGQIKTSLDFSVTNTSLSLFQWFKFEDTYNKFFTAKFAQIASDARKLGQKQTFFSKLLFGWAFLLFFLIILFGPLLLFSNFNPISKPNIVKNMILTLGVSVDGAQFELFSNSHPKLVRQMTTNEYYQYFKENDAMINYSADKLMIVEMYPFSDNSWEITSSMYQTLTTQIYDALSSDNNTTKLYYRMSVEQTSGVTYFQNESVIEGQQILDMHELLVKCSQSKIIIPKFYYMVSIQHNIFSSKS